MSRTYPIGSNLSKSDHEDEFLSTPATIIFVVVMVAFCITLVWAGLNNNQKYSETSKKAYIEAVRQNIFQGELLGLIYQSPETTIVKNDREGGAIVGGVFAAGAGFVPIGIGVGALLGAGTDEESSQITCRRLWLLAKSGLDTSCFEIVHGSPQEDEVFFQTTDRALFAKAVLPNRSWFVDSLKVGEIIRIPASAPLSKDSRIYSVFLYRENEKIPYIDD